VPFDTLTESTKRKVTTLRSQQAQIALAHDLARVGAWEWDLQTGAFHGSPELLRILGLDEEPSSLLEYWLSLVHPDDRARVTEILMNAAATGEECDAHYRVVRPDGETLYFHSRARVVGDGETLPRRLVGMAQDVSTHVANARALQESEARYRELITGLPALIWCADADGKVLFTSETTREVSGYSVEEITAGGIELWISRVHPDDVNQMWRHWQALFDGTAQVEWEYRFQHRNGDWIWLHERVAMLHSGSGPRVVGICSDVTDRRMAAEALRTSEARNRTLVDEARDVIFSLDVQGRIRSINKVFEQLTDWKREEWIGRPFIEMVDPAYRERSAARFSNIVGGEPSSLFELNVRDRNGRSISIETAVHVVKSDGGTPLEIIGIARDITRRKELDAEKARDKHLAGLGQLATSVAHEFNNILMSIMPFAELLQKRMGSDEHVAISTQHIIQAVRRGRDISHEILRFARTSKVSVVPVKLRDTLPQLVERLSQLIGQFHPIQLRIDSAELIAAAEPVLLEHVITNLVLNARDAMADGGTIEIIASSSAGGESIDIDVRDSGVGIRRDLLDRIFEPLFTTKRGGNGMGLSIAYQAMSNQGGSLHVQSTEGEGSTFTAVFPTATGTPVAVETPPRTRRRRVLLVEDDESVGEGMRFLLADEGFDVRLITRGGDAARAIDESEPDILVLDVNLPDVNGFDLYEHIHAAYPEMPVIFSTGHADAGTIETARRSVPVIMKPYDIAELVALINKVA
jgi:two-component system, cell cycle sensor histidine kinase and response regulator CckA